MTRAMRAIVLAGLALYPATVVWLATRSGIGISQDSVSYLATARSVGAGAGLTTFTGAPLTLFPPGLPALLGVGEALGGSALDSARLLNVACIVLIVLGTYLLAAFCGLGDVSRLVATAAVSLSAAFLGVFSWLWTEPLFTVLVMVVLGGLAWSIQRRTFPWWLVIAVGVAASLASSVRYIGLVLVPLVPLGAWLALAERGRRAWLGRAVVGMGIALVVPALLVVRNLSLDAGPLGERSPGSRTLQGALAESVDILGSFLAPPGSTQLTSLAGAVVLVLVLAGTWWSFLARRRSALLVAAYALVYLAVVTWSQAATRLDAPSARLLAPAVPAVAVLAVLGGTRVLTAMRDQANGWAAGSESTWVRSHGGRVAGALLSGAVAFCLVVAALAAVAATQRMIRNGPEGSLDAGTVASPLVRAVAALPRGAGVAANDPWTAYLARGNPPVLGLPPSVAEWPAERVARDTQALAAAVASGRVSYAAVLETGAVIEPLGALESAGVRATQIESFPDGVLYRLETVG